MVMVEQNNNTNWNAERDASTFSS